MGIIRGECMREGGVVTRATLILLTPFPSLSCFITRWLGLPLTNGRLFEMDAGGVCILSYAHHNFEEPTIAGMFSSKT